MGVLLLGAAAGLAWYLFRSNEYATYQIRTQDVVSGLIADAPVEFHGVEVGKVKRVELTDPHSVRILLSVKKDAPITTATVATITGRGLATRGFTGYVYVSLEDLGSDARPLIAAAGRSFPAIPTAPSRSATLDTAISQLNQNVQSMTDLLESALDRKTIASLKQSASDLPTTRLARFEWTSYPKRLRRLPGSTGPALNWSRYCDRVMKRSKHYKCKSCPRHTVRSGSWKTFRRR